MWYPGYRNTVVLLVIDWAVTNEVRERTQCSYLFSSGCCNSSSYCSRPNCRSLQDIHSLTSRLSSSIFCIFISIFALCLCHLCFHFIVSLCFRRSLSLYEPAESRTIQWGSPWFTGIKKDEAGGVCSMHWEVTNTYNVFVWQPQGNIQHCRPRR
jgi:hypothetical protein